MASHISAPWKEKPAAVSDAARMPAKPPAARRRTFRVLALLALLAAIGSGGYYGWRTWTDKGSASGQFAVAQALRGDLEDVVTATGTLQPRDFVDVGTQVSGQLKKLHVEIGSVVKAGDLLAEIDPTVYMARVDADRAQLRNLEAQHDDKQAQLALARQQLQRQQNLMKEEATTAEQLEQAQASVRSLTAQIESVKAQIQQTESSLRGDEANLGYTKIYAPMSGTVASLIAKQGQTLNANQQAPLILRIADLSTMTVQAQVSEADVPRLRLGIDVYFTTLGGDGKRWYGRLRQVNPTPTVVNNVVLYDALFDVPNANGELMTQMTAQVFFVAASARDALYVPVSALRPAAGEARRKSAGGDTSSGKGRPEVSDGGLTKDKSPRGEMPQSVAARPADRGADPRRLFAGTRALVRVAAEDGSVSQREVQVGMVTRVSAQILAGLEDGERVIVGPRVEAGGKSAAPGAPKFTPRL
jgi:macrolide-specific efflux system membrane fusion protein